MNENIPIIEGEDLLRIYREIDYFTGKYACLSYDMFAVSSTGEQIQFERGTLVQIFPYLKDEAVEGDKWNGYGGGYMGQYHKVLHSISVKAYYNHTLEEYAVWTNERPIKNQLDAHMSCMKGLDFLRNVFCMDARITRVGKHLDDYLCDYRKVRNVMQTEKTKTAFGIIKGVFGMTLGFIFLCCVTLVFGISSKIATMFGGMAFFFIVCYIGVKHLSKDDKAKQAIIEEWDRCNRQSIESFGIISNLHGGEPFS